MIQTTFRLMTFLLIGILLHNHFLGNKTERETSRKVLKQFSELMTSVKDMVILKKERLDNGDYDRLLKDMEKMFKKLKVKVEGLSFNLEGRVNDLERKRQYLEERLKYINYSAAAVTSENFRSIPIKVTQDIDYLLLETESLISDIENQSREY